jgi:hypothetical protein
MKSAAGNDVGSEVEKAGQRGCDEDEAARWGSLCERVRVWRVRAQVSSCRKDGARSKKAFAEVGTARGDAVHSCGLDSVGIYVRVISRMHGRHVTRSGLECVATSGSEGFPSEERWMHARSCLNYVLPFELFDPSLDFESAYALSSCAHTASVTSLVPALPPRSRVRMPRSVTASTLSISFLAALSSPSQMSISDAVQKVATGLATPLPVMSKAEPWIGSNMDG